MFLFFFQAATLGLFRAPSLGEARDNIHSSNINFVDVQKNFVVAAKVSVIE
ncbi:MAG: hypothetical protein ACJAU0_001334 [Flavobacteriales bacterium]|jgi:hypothetical protein